MSQLINQVLQLRRGDSYSGAIVNDVVSWTITALADISAATAYLTVTDNNGTVIFQKTTTPAATATTNVYDLDFVVTSTDTLLLTPGYRSGKFEVSIVLAGDEDTLISGRVDVIGDLDQQIDKLVVLEDDFYILIESGEFLLLEA